tara:strand:+ start:1145 stop:1267 length:123 start_codon:yes stop_codon:yes gene_type:complete
MSWDRKAERKERFDKRSKAKDKQRRKREEEDGYKHYEKRR